MQQNEEKSFRPQYLKDYQGQEKVKKLVTVYIQAAKMRNETLDHVLITGSAGCGKSTIAGIIANEMGGEYIGFSAMTLKKKDDMYNMFGQIQEGTVILLDEIQALSKKLQEMLYTAMENFYYDYVSEDVYSERIQLPHFTLVGITNEIGELTEPLKNRFPIQLFLAPYSSSDMGNIVKNSCNKMDLKITDEAANLIGQASRGVPRVCNALLRRVSDFGLLFNDGLLDLNTVKTAFEVMDVNQFGLNSQDMSYLRLLHGAHKAVGVDTIALSINLDKKTVENVVEPYLLQKQYIFKTPRGRVITESGKKILDMYTE
jgi:Holliday junction DNA helicase RuvB